MAETEMTDAEIEAANERTFAQMRETEAARARYSEYYPNRLIELGIIKPSTAQNWKDNPSNPDGTPNLQRERLSPTQLAQANFAMATGQIKVPNFGPNADPGSNGDLAHPVHALSSALNHLYKAGAPLTDLIPGGKATVEQVGKMASDALHTHYANDARDKFKEISDNPNLTAAERTEKIQTLLANMQFKGLSFSDLGDPEAVKQKLKDELAKDPANKGPAATQYNQNLMGGIDDKPPPGTKWKKEQECVQAFVAGKPGEFLREHASGTMDNGQIVGKEAALKGADAQAAYSSLMSGGVVGSVKSDQPQAAAATAQDPQARQAVKLGAPAAS